MHGPLRVVPALSRPFGAVGAYPRVKGKAASNCLLYWAGCNIGLGCPAMMEQSMLGTSHQGQVQVVASSSPAPPRNSCTSPSTCPEVRESLWLKSWLIWRQAMAWVRRTSCNYSHPKVGGAKGCSQSCHFTFHINVNVPTGQQCTAESPSLLQLNHHFIYVNKT